MLETLNILKTYGWKGLLLGLFFVFVYKFISEWSKAIFDKAKLRLLERRQTNLSLHSFFSIINYALNVEVPSLNVFPDKPVRQAVTRDLVHCSLAAMHEVAEKIIKNTNSDWTNAEWSFQTRNSLNEINSLFLSKCQRKGIPEPIYMKYLEWYFERLNYMRSLIDQIAASDLSPTIDSKTSTMLMLFTLFITTMMGDCERAIADLNGDITGLTYRGGIIESLGHHVL